MAGVIWLVQLVQYPMFAAIDRAAFRRHHAFHVSAITRVVLPPMLLELALAIWFAWRRADAASLAGLALAALLWVLTLGVMVPLHARLQAEGFSLQLHAALLRWNWVRTAAWTARGVLAAAMI